MKAEILGYWIVLIIYYCTRERPKNANNKSIDLIVDNYFLNVNFSITFTAFKPCLPNLHTHSEGTVSQVFSLGHRVFLCQKPGKV